MTNLSELHVEAWTPPSAEDRPDGFECLIWHRSRWRHVAWVENFQGWMFGYGSSFTPDAPGRLYAPLPFNTPEHGFFECREQSL